jgi:hypothetical protein
VLESPLLYVDVEKIRVTRVLVLAKKSLVRHFLILVIDTSFCLRKFSSSYYFFSRTLLKKFNKKSGVKKRFFKTYAKWLGLRGVIELGQTNFLKSD